jgi:pimeloyl-ACP methyl ester carboxylesterase
MDNRGVGNSDTPSGLYKTSEMARDIQELLQYVGWVPELTEEDQEAAGGRNLHIVGVSMGGMIAQELVSIPCRVRMLLDCYSRPQALLIPSRILSLSLISTSAGNAPAAPVFLHFLCDSAA